jgi:hypothetical protein
MFENEAVRMYFDWDTSPSHAFTLFHLLFLPWTIANISLVNVCMPLISRSLVCLSVNEVGGSSTPQTCRQRRQSKSVCTQSQVLGQDSLCSTFPPLDVILSFHPCIQGLSTAGLLWAPSPKKNSLLNAGLTALMELGQ